MRRKGKKLLITGLLAVTIGTGTFLLQDKVEVIPEAHARELSAYNHNPNNILDNTFVKDGQTILPFIYENSEEIISKEYVMDQFQKAGIIIQSISSEKIGTGTKIYTSEGNYTLLIYGDINGDGKVSLKDAQAIVYHYVYAPERQITGIYLEAANVNNKDEKVNLADAQRIVNFYIGATNSLVTNEPIADSEKDHEAPIITLKGANPQKIKLGTAYTELGATVTDNVDNNVKVVIETSNVNINKAGTYTVSYNATDAAGNKAKQVTRTVIVEDYVKGIKITAPTKTTYRYGENMDLAGANVKEVMASGIVSSPITMTDAMLKGYNKNQVGEQTITVSYSGFTQNFKVKVEDYTTGISLVSGPTKTTYTVGEELNLIGATIKEVMASGDNTQVIKVTNSMVSGYNKNQEGTQTITVTYKGFTTQFTVTVNPKPDDKVIGIEVTAPTKAVYNYGEELDLTGATYKEKKESGAVSEAKPITQSMISNNYDKNQLGVQTITVTHTTEKWGDVTATFTVKVVDYVTSIQVNLITTNYKYGQNLDLTGSTVTKIMASSATVAPEALTTSMISGYDNTKIGAQELTISYAGKTAKVQVNVDNYIKGIKIESNPTKLEYVAGNAIELAGMKVVAVKANNDETQDITADITTDITNAVFGSNTITVSYTTSDTLEDTSKTYTATFDISVVKELSSLVYTQEGTDNHYSKEQFILGMIAQGQDQEVVKPSELKAEVPTGVTVEFKLRKEMGATTPENQNDIIILVTAQEAGTYAITPYARDDKSITTGAINITVTKNPTVQTMGTIAFADKEVKKGEVIDKDLTFTNINGEAIDVVASRITIPRVDGLTITFLGEDKLDVTGKEKNAKYMRVVTTLEVETTKSIQILVDGQKKQDITLVIGGIPVVDRIEVADSIQFATALDPDNELIQQNSGNIYTLIKIDMYDQYNQRVNFTASQFDIANATAGKLTCMDSKSAKEGMTALPYLLGKPYGRDDLGDIVPVTGSNIVEYIGFSIDGAELWELRDEKITVIYGTNTNVKKEITINVPFDKLNNLLFTEETAEDRYSKESFIIGKLTQGANQEAIDMTKLRCNAPAGVTVEFKLRKDTGTSTADNQNDIIMMVTPTNAGTYELQAYMENDTSVTSTTINLTVTENPTVASMGDITFADREVKKGQSVDKTVTFTNVNGETIDVLASRINIPEVEGLTITLLDAAKLDVTGKEKVAKYLRVETTIETETTKGIQILVDGQKKQDVTLVIGGIPVVDRIDVADSIQFATALDPNNELIQKTAGTIYTLLKVDIYDQYNQKIGFTASQFEIANATAEKLTCMDSKSAEEGMTSLPYLLGKPYGRDDLGEIVPVTGSNTVEYIGFAIDGAELWELKDKKITMIYGTDSHTQKEITINVPIEKLSELIFTEETTEARYSTESFIVGKLTSGVNQEAIDITKLKCKLPPDITVEFKLRKDTGTSTAENQNDIVMIATPTKPGMYQIQAYMQDDTSVTSPAIDLTVTSNPTVVSMGNITFTDREVKKGEVIDKVLTFTNVNGETIDVEASRISIPEVTGLTITLLGEAKLDVTGKEKAAKYLRVETTLEIEATKAVQILVDGQKKKDITIVVGGKPVLDRVQIASSMEFATVLDPDNELTQVTSGTIYTLLKVDLYDQYNQKINLTADQFAVAKGTAGQLTCMDTQSIADSIEGLPYLLAKTYYKDEFGNMVLATGSNTVEYIGFAIDGVALSAMNGQKINFYYGTDTVIANVTITNI